MAPLSGYTDVAFRAACRRYGCEYAFTPLLDAGSLVYRNPLQARALTRAPDEPWLGVQLLGSEPEILGEAVLRLNEQPFDLLDLNLGCPVPKVTKRGAGIALATNLELALRCVESVVKVSRMPVTVKTRVLSGNDPEPTLRLARALEHRGIAALTIHGRVWQQIYSGRVAVEVIRAVRDAVGIPVIANGGVFDRQSGLELSEKTGCRRIMIARGAIGNPWIFRELQAPGAVPPSHPEVCDQIERHVLDMVAHYGEETGMRNARKIILAYLTGRGYRRLRRRAVTGLRTMAAFRELLTVVREEGPSPRFRSRRGSDATPPRFA